MGKHIHVSCTKNNGFTIVELLIVVVVIAILATIVIVSYNGIKARAQDSATLANIDAATKQIKQYTGTTGAETPGFDYVKAAWPSPFGIVSYAYENANFDSLGTTYGDQYIISKDTFKQRYGFDLKGNVMLTTFYLGSNNTGQYYEGSALVGVHRTDASIPKQHKPMRAADSVLNVSGWYIIYQSGNAVLARDGVVVCQNGSTPTSDRTTWAGAYQHRNVRMPLFNTEGKIELGSASLRIHSATISCAGTGGGSATLYGMVYDDTNANFARYGYMSIYPLEMSSTRWIPNR